jgi:hypothetical protein
MRLWPGFWRWRGRPYTLLFNVLPVGPSRRVRVRCDRAGCGGLRRADDRGGRARRCRVPRRRRIGRRRGGSRCSSRRAPARRHRRRPEGHRDRRPGRQRHRRPHRRPARLGGRRGCRRVHHRSPLFGRLHEHDERPGQLRRVRPEVPVGLLLLRRFVLLPVPRGDDGLQRLVRLPRQ